jgi:hypothetical protein
MTTRLFNLFKFIFILIISVISSCNWYGAPGSGLGSLADISDFKFKTPFYRKHTDSLLYYYPQFEMPDSIRNLQNYHSHLNVSCFYFDNPPKEVYFVQWEGTGFISIRAGYNVTKQMHIIENERINLLVSDQEKNRIKKRFQNEILNKLDSLIDKSADKDSAIFISPVDNKSLQEQ